MHNISCLIPTWLTATHALNAYRSFHRYYPDIPVYFVSDERYEGDENNWKKLHTKGYDSFDQDDTKLIGLPGTAFIRHIHDGWETEGHGNAVTYAMQFIHTKWVVHLSDDVRVIKPELLEYMMGEDNDLLCGIGEDFSRDWGPNLGKWLCLFRGDLYHKYHLDFHGNLDKCMDAGAWMFQELIKKGFAMKDINIKDYYVHLGSGKTELWDKYYEIDNSA